MIIGRIFGWLVTAVALMAVGAEVVAALEDGGYRGLAIGELWYLLDRESLNVSQAAVQRHVLPALWDGVVILLLQPAWLVFGIAGPVLVLVFGSSKESRNPAA